MFACVLIGLCPSPSQAGPSVVRIMKLAEQVNDAGTHPLLLHVMVITDLDGKCRCSAMVHVFPVRTIDLWTLS